MVIAGLWAAFVYFFPPPTGSGAADRTQVSPSFGSVAISGKVSETTVSVSGPVTNNNYGPSYEQVEVLVRERTKPLEDLTIEQRETIAAIQRNLDSNDAQIRAALESLGEENVPPMLLVPRLIGILQQFKELRSAAAAQPGDDAEIGALKTQVKQAIKGGERGKADDLLARIQTKQDSAQDRLAVERAATRAQRGQVALASLNFGDAAKHFAEAARTLPCGNDYTMQRVIYLNSESSAQVESFVSEHLAVNSKDVTPSARLVADFNADELPRA